MLRIPTVPHGFRGLHVGSTGIRARSRIFAYVRGFPRLPVVHHSINGSCCFSHFDKLPRFRAIFRDVSRCFTDSPSSPRIVTYFRGAHGLRGFSHVFADFRGFPRTFVGLIGDVCISTDNHAICGLRGGSLFFVDPRGFPRSTS